MAIKLEAKNNYFVITDTVTGDIENFPPQKIRFKIYSGTLHIIYMDRYADDKRYPLTDIVDSNGVAFGSTELLNDWLLLNTGNVNTTDVVVQSNTSPLLVVKASNLIAETTTTTLLSKDDLIINVADATGFVVGQYLTIYNVDANRVYFANIIAINALAISVNMPLDFEYPIGSYVSVGNSNMNVDGSVTPKIFGIRNPSTQDVKLKYDITRLIFTCLTVATVDLSKFGDIIGGLARGIVVRKKDGDYYNIFNARTNAELKNLMYDFDIQPASGNQQDGFTGRITFAGENKMGAVVRLAEQEDLEVIIQDDLTGLVSFTMISEGSQVTD